MEDALGQGPSDMQIRCGPSARARQSHLKEINAIVTTQHKKTTTTKIYKEREKEMSKRNNNFEKGEEKKNRQKFRSLFIIVGCWQAKQSAQSSGCKSNILDRISSAFEIHSSLLCWDVEEAFL